MENIFGSSMVALMFVTSNFPGVCLWEEKRLFSKSVVSGAGVVGAKDDALVRDSHIPYLSAWF